ncbi:MAG: MBL fold metallo-hydrolase [Anaerolineae bacterium]|nr:MBL fold metallo-hydrolase [Anaerolineae bacterium]MDK1080984.1 MBL fold metallo-hydrolase [Anaerolineae bacterium]MDK1117351.1 MBL fold metallo-hydrolase [Anaerolineae bacterium]
MAKLIILGTSNAVSAKDHENTHMVLVGQERIVMVDCVNNPIHRLEKSGVDFMDLTDIILTHFHPDHVSGVPLLLMDMWLQGRTKPINIYGLHHTLDRMEQLMTMYAWEDWPIFFPVAFQRLPDNEKTPVLACDEFKILCSPVHHLVPTIGLLFEFKNDKKLAYSCDTEPCEEVIRLAEGADVLIHEATGASMGHSSAEQAGQVAAQAEVDTLYLIHYPTGKYTNKNIITEAQKTFQRDVSLATDFMTLDF